MVSSARIRANKLSLAGAIGAGIITPGGVNLPKWKAAKAAVLAGARNGRLVVLSDSTGVSYPGAANDFANMKATAWPTRVAAQLGASVESWFGNADAGAVNRYTGAGGGDPRLNAGGWGLGGGSKIGLGQYPYVATASGTPFSFTPGKAFDTIEIFHLTDPTNGVGAYAYDVLCDGSVIGRIDGNQAEGFRRAAFTVPLGTHTITCSWVSGNCYLSGMIASNSAVKELQIVNCSVAGGKIADFVAPSSAARAYSPMNALAVLQPDAVALGLMVNDWNTPTVQTTFRSQTDTALARIKALAADGLVIIGPPTNSAASGRASIATQNAFAGEAKAAAAVVAAPVVDILSTFGVWADANTRGLMFDAVHPNAGEGQKAMAAEVIKPLLAA